MPKLAKPFREGKGWCFRQRVRGEDHFVSGHETASDARKEMARLVKATCGHYKPKGLGPAETILAQALLEFGEETFPFLKGAKQECRRLNRYLRAADLPTLAAVKLTTVELAQLALAAEQSAEKAEKAKTAKKAKKSQTDDETTSSEASGQDSTGDAVRHRKHDDQPPCWRIVRVPADPSGQRKIPRGLKGHREAQAKKTVASDSMRARLARMAVDSIARYDLQAYMNQMRKEGSSPANLQNERALLRGFLNYAHTVWHWTSLSENVAVKLKMPAAQPFIARVMSLEEQERLGEALARCRNNLIEPTVTLLRETAMRTSEPIDYARWRDVDWERQILDLKDSKTNARQVPLSTAAIAALRELQQLTGGKAEAPIVSITYESLKSAWNLACARAKIDGLRLYDLRHTAATRAALQFGNVWLVKALTGHKTLSMVERYTHVGAADMIDAWKEFDAARAASAKAAEQEEVRRIDAAADVPATGTPSIAAAPDPTDPGRGMDSPNLRLPADETPSERTETNVVQGNFGRRRTG